MEFLWEIKMIKWFKISHPVGIGNTITDHVAMAKIKVKEKQNE